MLSRFLLLGVLVLGGLHEHAASGLGGAAIKWNAADGNTEGAHEIGGADAEDPALEDVRMNDGVVTADFGTRV